MSISRIAREFPDSPIGLTGISLGGNVLLRYLAQADDVPGNVVAAVAISVPFDLSGSSRRIGQGLSRVYERFFLKSLKFKLLAKLEQFPQIIDSRRLAKVRTLYEFDDVVTASMHGFENAEDYYSRSSAVPGLREIRLPTLLISSSDDPFSPPGMLENVKVAAETNKVLHLDFHERGGHAGFVSGRNPFLAEYYAESRTVDFIEEHLSDLSPPYTNG